MTNLVTITAEMSDTEAEAFALFLKRSGLADYRKMTVGDNLEEAYSMRDAGMKLRVAFTQAGFDPR